MTRRFATHADIVTDAECQTENGNAGGGVFVSVRDQRLTNQTLNRSVKCIMACEHIFYSIPVVVACDDSLPGVPFNTMTTQSYDGIDALTGTGFGCYT